MRVVIAEDAALLREGLTRLLEDRGHAVCAAVTDGDGLLGRAGYRHDGKRACQEAAGHKRCEAGRGG